MGRHCCACSRKLGYGEMVFSFPLDPGRRKDWLDNAGLENIRRLSDNQIRNRSLCEKHFSNESFANKDRVRLLRTAVPTIFPSASKNCTLCRTGVRRVRDLTSRMTSKELGFASNNEDRNEQQADGPSDYSTKDPVDVKPKNLIDNFKNIEEDPQTSMRINNGKSTERFGPSCPTGFAGIFIKQEEDSICQPSLPSKIHLPNEYQLGSSANLESEAISIIQYSRNAEQQSFSGKNQIYLTEELNSISVKDHQLLQPLEKIHVVSKDTQLCRKIDNGKHTEGFIASCSKIFAGKSIKQEEDSVCKPFLPNSIQLLDEYQYGYSVNSKSEAVSLMQNPGNAEQQCLSDNNQNHSSEVLSSVAQKYCQLLQSSEQISVLSKDTQISPRVDNGKFTEGFESSCSTGFAGIFIKQEEDSICQPCFPSTIQLPDEFPHESSANLESRAVSKMQYPVNAEQQYLSDKNQIYSSEAPSSVTEKDTQLLQPSEQISVSKASALPDRIVETDREVLQLLQIVKVLEELTGKFDTRITHCTDLQLHQDFQRRIEMLHERIKRVEELTAKLDCYLSRLGQDNQRRINELTKILCDPLGNLEKDGEYLKLKEADKIGFGSSPAAKGKYSDLLENIKEEKPSLLSITGGIKKALLKEKQKKRNGKRKKKNGIFEKLRQSGGRNNRIFFGSEKNERIQSCLDNPLKSQIRKKLRNMAVSQDGIKSINYNDHVAGSSSLVSTVKLVKEKPGVSHPKKLTKSPNGGCAAFSMIVAEDLKEFESCTENSTSPDIETPNPFSSDSFLLENTKHQSPCLLNNHVKLQKSGCALKLSHGEDSVQQHERPSLPEIRPRFNLTNVGVEVVSSKRLLDNFQGNVSAHITSISENGSLDGYPDVHMKGKLYQCSICLKQFFLESTMAKHMIRHKRENGYQCRICKTAFTQLYKLTAHMVTHTGGKLYECETCKRKFTFKSSLRRHIGIHNDEKPYSCDICMRTFLRNSSLTRHIRGHDVFKRYRCHICRKIFSQKFYLTAHMKIHTGEKPYQCEMCKKTFTFKSNLTVHIRTHNGVEGLLLTNSNFSTEQINIPAAVTSNV